MEEEFDELKLRRKKLIEASRSPRTKEEIEKVLKQYKGRGIEIIIDDKECTITKTFEATINDPNNNQVKRRQEVSLTVSGNLFRPIEDFIHDARWLSAQVGSIQDAQKGVVTGRR